MWVYLFVVELGVSDARRAAHVPNSMGLCGNTHELPMSNTNCSVNMVPVVLDCHKIKWYCSS